MINKPNQSPGFNQTLLIGLIMIVFIQITQSSIDYCITNKLQDTIGLVGNQSVALTLGDYVRGYNLTFTSDQPLNARPSNPLDGVALAPLPFNEGYKIVSADVFQTLDKKWFQQGAVLAQKDTKNIALSINQFSGTRNLKVPKFDIQYYQLQTPANCFSANVVGQSSNVVIDCQTVDRKNLQDLVCFIDVNNKSITNCLKIDALNKVQDRKSQILVLDEQIFLLTGTYARYKGTLQMTYITIYRVDVVKKTIQFANIIDGYQLSLTYDITISDFDILKNGVILIHDVFISQLLFVQYTKANEIFIVGNPWVYGSEGVEIQVTNINTVLIATKSYVEEWDLTLKVKVFRYELEKGDNDVVGLGANTYGVVVQTSRGFLYVYQRIMGTVNYMLGSVFVGNKDYLISPYANVFYVFNEKAYTVYEITSGVLRLGGFPQSTNVTITAQSTTSSCRFYLQIKNLDSVQKIVEKQNISNKHFTAENAQTLSFNLQEIYSGQYLTYQAPKSTDEITFTLDQVATYQVTTGIKDYPMIQIIDLNKTGYFILGSNQTNLALQMCVTNDTAQQIICKSIYSDRLNYSNPILLTGRQRSSGQIVFVWTYEQGGIQYLGFNNGKFARFYHQAGQRNEISSVIIGQDKIFAVYKKYAQIVITKDLTASLQTIILNKDNFVPLDNQMTGFYPRQVYLHPRNTQLFYMKFPLHVCLMTMINNNPKVIDCNKVFQKIIPDQSWHVIIGTYTYVVFSPQGIKQYMILGAKGTQLHTINIGFTMPVYYSQFLNTAIFRSSTDGKVVYYKLNKPIIDCLYFSTPLSQQQLADSSQYFSSDGYWTVSTKNWNSYRQSYTTKLSIQLTGDNKSFKQDLKFSLKVKGTSSQINVDNNITIIRYPTNITEVNTTNDVLLLPNNANNQQFQVDVEKYLSGPKGKYNLVCDYCGTNITFDGAFKNRTDNKQIIGAQQIIEVFGTNVIVLTNNRINLVDNQSKLITYKIIEHAKKCTQMAWHQKVGLLVLCEDETGQQMYVFDVNEDNITQSKTTYPIHAQALISYADQIFIVQIDADSYWILIQDNDITDLHQKVSKKANVKVFVLSKDALQFKGILTTEQFGIITLVTQPINDIDVINGKIIVATIGNIGFGYATLADKKDAPHVLVNPQVVPLRGIPQIQAYLLDDTLFQQVQLLKSNSSTQLLILVTSSSSIAMVLQFNISSDSTLTFNEIVQSYNRYGTYLSVNWHAITQTQLLLSFYNVDDAEQYIVVYKRSNNTMIDFVQSLTIQINTYQLGQHTVYLTSTNVLFVSDVGSKDVDAKITRYDLKTIYNLILSYSQPGNFNAITLTASNQYSSEHVQMKVQFHNGGDDQNGVRWYTVMIIIIIILIIVGVAYGMYLKMIKHRKDKKVSLLTQGEQVDESI